MTPQEIKPGTTAYVPYTYEDYRQGDGVIREGTVICYNILPYEAEGSWRVKCGDSTLICVPAVYLTKREALVATHRSLREEIVSIAELQTHVLNEIIKS